MTIPIERTLHAWIVLGDCEKAADQLDRAVTPDQWRVPYVACVALLRTVGNVLQKVDARRDKNYGTVIREFLAFTQSDKKRFSIFWEFIKKERDIILKEYSFTSEGFMELPIIESTDEESGDLEVTGIFTTDLLLIDSDPGHLYEGHDIRNLVREAIEFWTSSLNYIEAARDALWHAEATEQVTDKPPSLYSGCD
jgi:hypothetical protein